MEDGWDDDEKCEDERGVGFVVLDNEDYVTNKWNITWSIEYIV